MKRAVIIIAILIIIGTGYWWFTQQTEAMPTEATLTGSGVIEAKDVAITAELGGRVTKINVAEGDEVAADQTLVELDQSALLAQQAQLAATLTTAKANLAAVAAPPRTETVALAEAQVAQAEVARDGAKAVWANAQHLAQTPLNLQAQLNQAQAQATDAASQIELAQVNAKRADIEAEAASRNQSNHAGLVQNEVAQHQLQASQTGLDIAQVAAEGADQQAQDWAAMVEQPLQLITQANAAQAAYQQAEAGVEAAQANLALVSASATAEDVAVARAQVVEADTALAIVKAQLAKQILAAPRAGLITEKAINVGELAAPGTTLLVLSDLDNVDLKIYIPETLIGQVQLGQKARVTVDAYPGQTFEGYVSFISPQAEFTPRNVQSQEERVNLVFAVKIHLDNPDHTLKPGMPADAELLAEVIAAPPSTPTPAVTATPTTSTPAASSPTPTLAVTAPLTTPVATPTPSALKQAKVLSYGLNVRRNPGMDQPVLTTLAQGDTVPVIAVSPDQTWLQIQLPGDQGVGWIAANTAYVALTPN